MIGEVWVCVYTRHDEGIDDLLVLSFSIFLFHFGHPEIIAFWVFAGKE